MSNRRGFDLDRDRHFESDDIWNFLRPHDNPQMTIDGKVERCCGAMAQHVAKNAARFPILEISPDGNLLLAWIDRRIDNPKPRQLYLMQLDPDGKELTKNFQQVKVSVNVASSVLLLRTESRQFT